MNRYFWIPLGCAALAMAIAVPVAVLASGGRDGFDGVVDSLESRYHVQATRIPLMGLVSLVAGKATNGGVRSVNVAEFEHFSGVVDGDELNGMVEERLGPGWERMVRETSRKGSEQTLIFAHPEGNRMGLFVVDLDGHEMDVVEVSVDPDRLNETLAKYNRRDRSEGEPD